MVGCSLAALCRGLRYEGDITLKEVAMAFQLRDAYDWDEDLEAAAAKQVGDLAKNDHAGWCLGIDWASPPCRSKALSLSDASSEGQLTTYVDLCLPLPLAP